MIKSSLFFKLLSLFLALSYPELSQAGLCDLFKPKTVVVEVAGVRIEGTNKKIRYGMASRNIGGRLLRIDNVIKTKDGAEFVVISIEPHPTMLRGKKFSKMNEAEKETALGELRGYSRPAVWRLALAEPERMAMYGIHADRDTLVVPTVETMNKIFDSLEGTPWAVGHRYQEHRSLTAKGQEYSHEEFFEALKQGKILVSTWDEYFEHDFLNDHFIGALMIPPRLFKQFAQKARKMEIVKQDPILSKELKADKHNRRGTIDGVIFAFASYWDGLTSELSITDGIVRNGGGYHSGSWDKVEDWSEVRKLLLKVFNGETLSKAEGPKLQVDFFKTAPNWPTEMNLLQFRDEYLSFEPRLLQQLSPKANQRLLEIERSDP